MREAKIGSARTMKVDIGAPIAIIHHPSAARQRLDQSLHPQLGLLRFPLLPRRRPALHGALRLRGLATRAVKMGHANDEVNRMNWRV